MHRFLFYFLGFLFLGAAICNFSSIAFAYENEDSDGQDDRNSEESDSDDNNSGGFKKKRVHDMVDSILKINKSVDPNVKESRLRKLKKERELKNKEREEQRKKGLDESGDNSDESDAEAKNSSAKKNKRSDAKTGAKTKNRNDNSVKTSTSTSHGHSRSAAVSAKSARGRWSKSLPFRHSSYFVPQKVFTVKNIKLSPYTTNKYLRSSYNSMDNYRTKRYGNILQKTRSSMEYKIKSYSENQDKNTAPAAESPSSYEKFTIKSKDYFRNKSCDSIIGCSS
ncbi:MAG: hypothetical protein LBC04_00055 [Holosporaceae bacterium]|jgi:hypothetical protein|nr:hypothetical protein [Holosporaceae bacterium]